MGRKLSPVPSSLQFTVFTRQEAYEHRLTPGQLRSRQYIRLARNIYCHHTTQSSPEAIARAYSRSHPRIVISGLLAARHYGFPLPYWLDASKGGANTVPPAISLWARTWRRDNTGHHLEWNTRRLKPGDVITQPDPDFSKHIRITTVERTWFDLAEFLDLENMVIVLDYMMRVPIEKFEGRLRPLTTLARVHRFLESRRATPGVRIAREALRLARVGADSPQETRVRLACREAGLLEPLVNEWVCDADGVKVVRPDLQWPAQRLALEYDGEVHDSSAQRLSDAWRDEKTRQLGWKQIVVRSPDLRAQQPLGWTNRDEVAQRVRWGLARRRPLRPLGVRRGHFGVKLRVWQPAPFGLDPGLADSPVVARVRQLMSWNLAA